MNKEELIELLEEIREYFDDRSDADHDGERFVANQEMKMMDLVDNVIAKIRRPQKDLSVCSPPQ